MIDTLGIHTSVDQVFPPETLRDLLADGADADDLDIDIRVVSAGDAEAMADCDALVTFAHEDAFLDANLDWVHSIQAGVDRFPFDAFEEREIALTNSTGIHGDSVGDTVAGYMLNFARRLHVYRDQQRERTWEWPAHDEPFSLRGERLCVVGLGGLGGGIAARADALGMDVVGVKRTPTPVEAVGEVYPSTQLHEAIADARFVALAVPLTPETEGLIGFEELREMREDAYLINVARGDVVVQDRLVPALRQGAIAGAALDTFTEEPLPADSPLWEMENVIVTPHAAAAHREYADRVAAIVAESLRRLERGDGYANRVL